LNNKTLLTTLASVALIATSYAQSSELHSLITQAQERSGLVKSARSIVEARMASVTGAQSNASPVLELSPGVGYTNGNAVLSQEIDFFGRRRSSARLARAELKLAEIDVARAEAAVSQEFLTSFAKLLGAQEELESAHTSLESAASLLAAVAKQFEIGEAPRVHVTRAELDVHRASQQVTLAAGRVQVAQASIHSLVGEEIEVQSLSWPKFDSTDQHLSAQSFELLETIEHVGLVEAQMDVIRSQFAPSLSAGVATDVWSLDRNGFLQENFGIQISFRMPLFDSGQKRGALVASRNEFNAAETRVVEAQRIANLRLAEATTLLNMAQAVVASYDGDVLPKGESMLIAMREGYASGLITLVEVLEAQQTLVKLRQERTQAVLNVRLAEVELWRALMTLPGSEVPR